MSELSVETKAELYDRIVALVLSRLLKAEGQKAKGGEATEAEVAVVAAAAKIGK